MTSSIANGTRYVDTEDDVRTKATRRRERNIGICVVAMVLIGMGVGLGVGLTRGRSKATEEPISVPKAPATLTPKSFLPNGNVLEFMGTDDGLDVTWYHRANSIQQMEDALIGSATMIEADILLRWAGYPNQTDEPIMAHPPDVDSNNTFENWIDAVLAAPQRKGLKLDFKSTEVVAPTLRILNIKRDKINQPIWANSAILPGPGTDEKPKDKDRFLSDVLSNFPDMTLSLDWTTGCCDEMFSRQMMENMWDVVKELKYPVTFPTRAALLRGSWPHYKWLLQQDPSRLSMTLWSVANSEPPWEGATIYDILYVRNDIDKSMIYYDLPGEEYEEFKKLAVTAGSVFNHFTLAERDGLLITWASAVNNRQMLSDAVKDDSVLFLEADVMLYGQGSSEQNKSLPVMANNPPAAITEFTLQQFMTAALSSNKGIKLDFKYIEAVEPSLKVLKEFQNQTMQPIWLHADVFVGPGGLGSQEPMDSIEFRRVVLETYPYCTLSLGWTTGASGLAYDANMVDEMAAYAASFQQPITFSIRAIFARLSWNLLKTKLLDISRSYSLTIWSSSEDELNIEDMAFLRQCAEAERIYYDLPEEQMKRFMQSLDSNLLQFDCDLISSPSGDAFLPNGNVLEFMGTDDGLDVTWYHRANSIKQMEDALIGSATMIEADILLRWAGYPNQTDEPIMAHPPDVDSDNTFENWIDAVLAAPQRKGLKLDFKSTEVVAPTLRILNTKRDKINQPIWANSAILPGPGTDEKPKDKDRFLSDVLSNFPDMTLSLDWTTGCCDEMFSRQMMENMWDVVKELKYPVTFPTRAALLRGSWPHYKWLLQQDPSRLSMTLWSVANSEPPWEGATIYDILYVRNDIDKSMIYYDLPGEEYEEFKKLAVTAGSVFNHFTLAERDGLLITWASAVNNRQMLSDAVKDDSVLFLEADVMLYGQGSSEQNKSLPVMANNPPAAITEFTLQQFMTAALPSNKGIKLDFKYIEAVEPSLKVLKEFQNQTTQPIWLHADVFVGPGGSGSQEPVDSVEFRRVVLETLPYCTLSLGWTTGASGIAYDANMVDEMTAYAASFQQPITFSIRAIFARLTWNLLKTKLLDISRSYSLTIWSSPEDELNIEDMAFLRQCAEAERIYYDLPEEQMKRFMQLIDITSSEFDCV